MPEQETKTAPPLPPLPMEVEPAAFQAALERLAAEAGR
jgi:hypothetical protein